MNYGWQSEAIDGPTGGWNCIFRRGYNGCSGYLTTLLDIVWRSAVAIVVVVVVKYRGVVVVM